MSKKLRKLLYWFIGIVLLFVFTFVIINNVVMPQYVQHGKTTRVPNVQGLPIQQAIKILEEAGLKPKEADRKQDKNVPIDAVISQNPLPNTEVKFGRGVYLIVSGGEQVVTVPNIRATSIREATFTLERYGLKVGTIQYEPSEEFFENTIIDQVPAAGTKVSIGIPVNIIVSQGRPGEKELVPSLIGKSYTEAEKLILQSGFIVGKVSQQQSFHILPNTVVEQYPRQGELAKKGSPIDVIVAQKADTNTIIEY